MTIRSISSLGACHPKYPIKQLRKVLEQCGKVQGEIPIRWLDLFFNERNSKNVTSLMSLPFRKTLMPAIINGPGLNNNRVQPHEITYGYNQASLVKEIEKKGKFLLKFEARVKTIKKIADKSTTKQMDLVAINPWLEHGKVSDLAMANLSSIIWQYFLQARIIDNPRGGSPFVVPKYYRELHGFNPDKNLWSNDLDGEDFFAGSLVDYYNNAVKNDVAYCFAWDVTQNGMSGKEPAWLPPQKRTYWPTSREFRVYEKWIEGVDATSPLDAQDTKGLKVQPSNDGKKQDFVWKLGDGKNSATILFPKKHKVKFKSVKIVKNGKVICKPTFRGFYKEDKSNRQIWDCIGKHTSSFPDNCVIQADGMAWIIEKAAFRVD
ncbi:hypothetical protein UFOVP591_27 [uncultured Caudovirales phage]|uniref:Uncharacterized protein n=1 Tax=uncultured Caudovirales phage TaxID=2100421 RepID=A0A6J5MYV4_9CAUD|nr:hypothetical protein UFOVP591_27 [uncultured Caudovirales phage]